MPMSLCAYTSHIPSILSCMHTNLSYVQRGRTALHLASKNGYKEVVKLLIDNGADVDEGDKVTSVWSSWHDICLLVDRAHSQRSSSVARDTASYISKSNCSSITDIIRLLE